MAMRTHTEAVPMEHERRFVPDVGDIPEDLVTTRPRAVIMQAYLEDAERTRIREETKNGTTTYTLTRKSGSGVSRTEVEMEIPYKDFEALKEEMTCSLQKIRRFLVWDGIEFQFNEYYSPASLVDYVQIEVEFDTHDEAVAFVPPAWFGKEVTDDSTHGNFSLAKYGKPK